VASLAGFVWWFFSVLCVLTTVLALTEARGAADLVNALFIRSRLRFHRLARHRRLLPRWSVDARGDHQSC
jgi:hypothetical protein